MVRYQEDIVTSKAAQYKSAGKRSSKMPTLCNHGSEMDKAICVM
jgi:hypothetical protein